MMAFGSGLERGARSVRLVVVTTGCRMRRERPEDVVRPLTVMLLLMVVVGYCDVARRRGMLVCAGQPWLEFCWIWLALMYLVVLLRSWRSRPGHAARVWPLALPPLLFGVAGTVLAAIQVWARCTRWPSDLATDPFSFWLVDCLTIGFPLVASGLIAASLLLLGWAVRLPSAPGRCPWCGYDVHACRSGRCPECGTVQVDDPTIPRHYFASRFPWLPELAGFPDAGARKQALESAFRASRPYGLLIVPVLLVLWAVRSNVARVGNACWDSSWPLFVAFAVQGVAVLVERRRLRRRLRASLNEMRCG